MDWVSFALSVYFAHVFLMCVPLKMREDIQPEKEEGGRSWWRCCCCLLVPLYSVSVCRCPTLPHLFLIPSLAWTQRSRRILRLMFTFEQESKIISLFFDSCRFLPVACLCFVNSFYPPWYPIGSLTVLTILTRIPCREIMIWMCLCFSRLHSFPLILLHD